MIPYHTTQIDTLTIQINCETDYIQRKIVANIKDYLQTLYNSYFDMVEYRAGFDTRIEQKVYSNNRTVFSIRTGFSQNNYYIKIRFAGLKTYDVKVDFISCSYLWIVIAYLNTNELIFFISELDITIDVANVDFSNLLAFCSSHTSRTVYHRLDEKQLYDGQTTYIEKFKDRTTAIAAVKRAYIYDKTLKEIQEHNNFIDYKLQRFEVKLQGGFFNSYGLDINAISVALSKYHLLYFKDIITKYNFINRYNNYSRFTKREINRMDLEEIRFYPNIEYINDFIYLIKNINIDDIYASCIV